MVGKIGSVLDVDMREYIIRQGLDILVTKPAIADLTYAVNDSNFEADRRQRLLAEVNLRAGNLTIALIENMKILKENEHDVVVTENIANQLIGIERLVANLLKD